MDSDLADSVDFGISPKPGLIKNGLLGCGGCCCCCCGGDDCSFGAAWSTLWLKLNALSNLSAFTVNAFKSDKMFSSSDDSLNWLTVWNEPDDEDVGDADNDVAICVDPTCFHFFFFWRERGCHTICFWSHQNRIQKNSVFMVKMCESMRVRAKCKVIGLVLTTVKVLVVSLRVQISVWKVRNWNLDLCPIAMWNDRKPKLLNLCAECGACK